MSSSYTSSSTSYTSTINGETVGQRSTQESHTDASGTTTVRSTTQNLGEPAFEETARFDAQGRQVEGGGADGSSRRIEDVTQAENDRKYEEAMEDEYAKREGGA